MAGRASRSFSHQMSRYHHYNTVEGAEEDKEATEEAGLRKRKVEKEQQEQQEQQEQEEKQKGVPDVGARPTSQDPIRWFGLLPPPALRRAQVGFNREIVSLPSRSSLRVCQLSTVNCQLSTVEATEENQSKET